ncbi:MAG: CoB--CoM heterodisulfide reductase iron-sulfur subunit A family protein [Roseiarcus sp.]
MASGSNGSGALSQTILVVGGGIAGVSAALEAAEAGQDVILIERDAALGGRVTRLNRYFPKLCHPTCGLEINYQRLRKNARVKVLTMSEVVQLSGTRGAYEVEIRRHPRYVNERCTACGECAKATETLVANPYNYGLDKVKAAYLPHAHAYPMRYVVAPEAIAAGEGAKLKAACAYGALDPDDKGETFALTVGAVIWATGWKPYDPAKLDLYSYAQSPDIITNVEMERLAAPDGPTGGRIVRPSNGEPAKRIALIQCAGSRDLNHLPYCSRICCLGSLKHAAYLREQYADAEAHIYYIDIRAHDKLEAFYNRVRSDPQVTFIKSKPAHIRIGEDGRPVLHGERTIEREMYAEPYDLVVLATGMQPSTVAGFSPKLELETDEYGFLVAREEDDGGGVFSAGVAAGPLDVSMSVQSATAAALKAVQAVRSL